MNRRLSLYLLGLVVAASGTACVKGAGGTSPDPVPSGPPARWSGTARFTRDLVADSPNVSVSSSSLWTVDVVNVTWVRDANPNPAPPSGGARYLVESGALHVSFRDDTDFGRGKRCSIDSRGEFPLPTDPPSPSGDGSVLELRADGGYEGRLYGSVGLEYLQVCTDGLAFRNRTTVHFELDINGALEGGRMRGEMAPRVLTTEVLTSTRAGAWDFTAN